MVTGWLVHSDGIGRARQIWPPGAGLSSTTVTETRPSSARRAAASPAGPAPMIRTSVIGADLHPLGARNLAASAVGAAVDRDAAFEADAHAAQRAAWLARHRSAEEFHAEDGHG